MSQLSIKVSSKGEAMIATLQKEIFNRRRKKVTASQVVETLVESGAKSQSDKRYAASWKNLIKDIEKAAKASEIHGNKPANISADEWALILSHRTRKANNAKKVSSKAATTKPKSKIGVVSKKIASKRTLTSKVSTSKVRTAVKKVAAAQSKKTSSNTNSGSKRIAKTVVSRPAKRARKVKTNAGKV